MRLVKTGPSLKERMERRINAAYHRTVIARLCDFQRQLEQDMEPEPWTALEAPIVLILADVCDAITLTDEERTEILGQEGEQVRLEMVESPPTLRAYAPLNGRQVKAMVYLQKHSRITNREYQALCPDVSPETLRLDLADLAARGLLHKNGRRKGTFYVRVS